MPNHIHLRAVIQADLPLFFTHQLEPDANYMAAFTAKDPADKDAFMSHWAKILNDDNVVIRAILFEEQLVGHILCHAWLGEPEVSYWVDKAYWQKGITTQALTLFLTLYKERPLYARVVKDNHASLRVLEKCGFLISGEDKGFANARNQEVEEYILKVI